MCCCRIDLLVLVALLPSFCWGQFDANIWQPDLSFTLQELPAAKPNQNTEAKDSNHFDINHLTLLLTGISNSPANYEKLLFRGQNSGTDGGDAGAGAATNPSVPLAQIQFQNVFIPETHDASGYSNQFIIQPVIPLNLAFESIPYHIIRPTLPVTSPTADPNGPLGVEGGLGDLTIIDVFVYPVEKLKTNLGAGYIAVAPTATDPQLGLQE